MSRYNNPNSKRKQKARNKARAKEMCTYHMTTYDHGGTDAPLCVTPDEFVRLENKERFIAHEETTIKRKRRHKEPKQLTAAA